MLHVAHIDDGGLMLDTDSFCCMTNNSQNIIICMKFDGRGKEEEKTRERKKQRQKYTARELNYFRLLVFILKALHKCIFKLLLTHTSHKNQESQIMFCFLINTVLIWFCYWNQKE